MITLNLKPETEKLLRETWGADLPRAVAEATLVDGYRAGAISTGDIAHELQLETRAEAEKWLAARGVTLNYALGDADADRATLDRVLGTDAR